mgnify:CR=1 FL=1
MNIRVEFDEGKCAARIKADLEKAQKALDAQVMADSNFFVPLKTGALQKSAQIYTRIGSGKVEWRTPYARRQYYGETFSHARQANPNATAKWFETAKARFLEKWVRLVNSIVHG